jgi:hypothetical protein
MRTSQRCLSVAFVLFCTIVLSGCLRPKPWTPNPLPTPPPPDAAEFNVMWDNGDPNGFPKNPYWSAQAVAPTQLPPLQGDKYDDKCVQQPNLTASEVTPGKEACTTQPTVLDQPYFFPNVLCFLEPGSVLHGHVDWTIASATGYVSWLNLADDWDYNFRFIPAPETTPPQENRGITTNNNFIGSVRYIEIEFASSEVADQFQTPWWQGLAQQVDSLKWDGLPGYIHPSNKDQEPFAVVAGLFGLDCEHDCRSEFHPVYALAIQLTEDARANVWEIFVRNWGNEGFCSSLNHELNLKGQKLSLLLPWSGATALTAKLDQIYPSGSTPVVGLLQDQSRKGLGALVTFTLPPPSARYVIEARLSLYWTGGTAPQPRAAMEAAAMRAMSATADKEGEQTAEQQLGELRKNVGLTKSAKPQALQKRALQPQAPLPSPVSLKVKKYRIQAPPSAATFSSTTNPVPDQVKRANDVQVWKQVCAELKTHPQPDLDPRVQEVCTKMQ